MWEIFINSISIMERQITVAQLNTDPPDVLIRPDLGRLRMLEFNRGQEAIREGYRAAKARVGALIEKGGICGAP